MKNWAAFIDQSLIRYFVTKALGAIEPPYSGIFVTEFLAVIEQTFRREHITRDSEIFTLLKEFFRYCLKVLLSFPRLCNASK